MFVLLIAFYLLPTIVANSRKVYRTGGIVALNLFLGWTVLGWIIALVWAFSAETQTEAFLRNAAYQQLARSPRKAEW